MKFSRLQKSINSLVFDFAYDVIQTLMESKKKGNTDGY